MLAVGQSNDSRDENSSHTPGLELPAVPAQCIRTRKNVWQGVQPMLIANTSRCMDFQMTPTLARPRGPEKKWSEVDAVDSDACGD
jgi:hypothetical protein